MCVPELKTACERSMLISEASTHRFITVLVSFFAAKLSLIMPNFREKRLPITNGYKVLESVAEDGNEDLSTEEDFEVGPRKSTLSRIWTTLKSVTCSPAGKIMAGRALLALGLPLTMNIGFRSRVSRRPANKCYCGTSTAQAKELGCKFDPMAPAWLPAKCRHQELTDAFERAGSLHELEGRWRNFADQNMTREVSMAQVAAMADTGDLFYTSYNWHVMHCMFVSRSLLYSLVNSLHGKYGLSLYFRSFGKSVSSRL